MANQTIFKRYEYKYLLTADQKKDLLAYMETYMKPDTFGRNTICNLYFDTPDYLLIRRSIEGKVYKEKIRLRTYGRAQDDSEAFIELKKKYKKVVYKRRVRTEYADAVRYLCQGEDSIEHSQIRRELDYAMQMYQGIRPAVYLSYEREAFYGKDDHELRITFAQNILWRTTQGSLLVNLMDNQSGEITLEDGDGNTLVSYTSVREYNSVVISCAELSDGSTYTIHTGENSQEVTMDGLVYTDGEAANAPGQGGGQMPQGGPMGENNDNSDNSDDSDRPTPPQGQGNPPDMQNGERPQADPPQGNPGDSSNEQTKEESDGQK